MAITGILAKKVSLSRGQGSVSIASAVLKKTSKSIGAGSMVITGGLIRKISKVLAGSMAIAGSLGRGFWHPIIEKIRYRFPTRYTDPSSKLSGYEDPKTRWKYPSDYE